MDNTNFFDCPRVYKALDMMRKGRVEFENVSFIFICALYSSTLFVITYTESSIMLSSNTIYTGLKIPQVTNLSTQSHP